MAITVDDATVARWTGTPNAGVDITSASFTPPNNSLLVVCVTSDTGDDSSGGPADGTFTCSGGSLTWTQRVERDDGVANGEFGHASIHTAPVGTGASMTIGVQYSGMNNGKRVSAKAYIITGQHASPIGATNHGSSTTNNLTASLTATGAGRLFGCATDWNALGAPTSTDTEDAAHYAGAVSVLSAYKSADHSSGSQSINFDASGTSAADWNWVLLEILAAAGGGGGSPAFRLSLLGVGR